MLQHLQRGQRRQINTKAARRPSTEHIKIDLMNPKIQNVIQRLESGMLDYMKESGSPYKKKHVDKCIQIINSYLDSMAKSRSKEQGLEVVKKAVLL
jgi:hypothetical protein